MPGLSDFRRARGFVLIGLSLFLGLSFAQTVPEGAESSGENFLGFGAGILAGGLVAGLVLGGIVSAKNKSAVGQELE